MDPVRAIVDGQISLSVVDTDPYILERLQSRLTLANPKYFMSKRFSKWGTKEPETIECYQHSGEYLKIPRGAVNELKSVCDARGVEVIFENKRIEGEPITTVTASWLTLRPYQKDAANIAAKHFQGMVVMPCGGGKTVFGIALIHMIARSSIILVHTKDLLEQWRNELRSILSLEAGVVGGGQRKIAPVTIATVQTLVRMDRSSLNDLARQFGVLVLDEAHHAPATTFRKVIGQFPAKWRIGLTATPRREDGLTRLLNFTMGPQLYEVTYDTLISEGYLHRPTVIEVYTSFAYDYPEELDDEEVPGEIEKCVKALISDEGRNAGIIDLVAKEASAGHSCLIISSRVEHCRVLNKGLTSLGIRAELMIGATKQTDRNKFLLEFKSGQLKIVVASTIADEGLDVPRLDRVMLAFPEKAKGRTVQRIGRIMRKHQDKTDAVLYDFVDLCAPFLNRRWASRRSAFKKMGAQIRKQVST